MKSWTEIFCNFKKEKQPYGARVTDYSNIPGHWKSFYCKIGKVQKTKCNNSRNKKGLESALLTKSQNFTWQSKIGYKPYFYFNLTKYLGWTLTWSEMVFFFRLLLNWYIWLTLLKSFRKWNNLLLLDKTRTSNYLQVSHTFFPKCILYSDFPTFPNCLRQSCDWDEKKSLITSHVSCTWRLLWLQQKVQEEV